tara:strand:+ start:327 stop:503 length:177 start_codon:yes stop_codon:yes gene_type:complete
MEEVIRGMIKKVMNEIDTYEYNKMNYNDGAGHTYDLLIMMSKRQLKDLNVMLDLASQA